MADRIIIRDLEMTVTVEGEGEVVELGQSIKGMRVSVNTAIERVENRKGSVVVSK